MVSMLLLLMLRGQRRRSPLAGHQVSDQRLALSFQSGNALTLQRHLVAQLAILLFQPIASDQLIVAGKVRRCRRR